MNVMNVLYFLMGCGASFFFFTGVAGLLATSAGFNRESDGTLVGHRDVGCTIVGAVMIVISFLLVPWWQQAIPTAWWTGVITIWAVILLLLMIAPMKNEDGQLQWGWSGTFSAVPKACWCWAAAAWVSMIIALLLPPGWGIEKGQLLGLACLCASGSLLLCFRTSGSRRSSRRRPSPPTQAWPQMGKWNRKNPQGFEDLGELID